MTPVQYSYPGPFGEVSIDGYNFSIICRISSLLFPSFFCSLPSNSSSLPSENTKSSSVRFPYCCLSLPFSSFHEPFICSLFIKFRRPKAAVVHLWFRENCSQVIPAPMPTEASSWHCRRARRLSWQLGDAREINSTLFDDHLTRLGKSFRQLSLLPRFHRHRLEPIRR
jgi:hypothetical protein